MSRHREGSARRFSEFLGSVLVALSLLGAPSCAWAQAQQVAKYDIAPQALEPALLQVADKQGLQLLYSPSDLKGIKTQGLAGTFSTKAAIEKLIEGTGLTASFNGRSAVAIKPANGARSATSGGKGENPTLLAQAQNPSAGASEPATQSAQEFEKIVVTGSRVPRIEGEHAVPVLILDRPAIERTGAQSVQELLNHVPQASINSLQTFAGSSTIQLRGFGTGTTLILINGRRIVTSGSQAAANYFDLSNVPIGAIDRVEVLASGASALYGADALAGVVNIILRKSVTGLEMGVNYGEASDGKAPQTRASIATGGQFERLHALLTLDYFDRHSLLGIPALGAARPSDFAATDGVLNLTAPFKYSSPIPETRRSNAFASATYDFGQELSVFTELMFSHAETAVIQTPLTFSGGRTGVFKIPATNPFNPFGVDVGIDYLLDALGPASQNFTVNFGRGLVGIRGVLGTEGNWEIGALATRDRSDDQFKNFFDLNLTRAALAQTDPASALNLFGTGPVGSPTLLNSLLRAAQRFTYRSNDNQIDASLSGPLMRLPAGAIQGGLGAELRKEKLDFFTATVVSGDRVARSVYGEMLVPLFAGGEDTFGMRSVNVTLAGRSDNYTDFGNTFNAQEGLEVRPVSSILVRASHSTSFKPPSLYQLGLPRLAQSVQGFDPRRGNEQYTWTVGSGGNPNLQPEDGRSLTAGIVFEPKGFANGLLLSADYFSVRLNNRIQSGNLTTIVTNESTFPDRVVRAPPTTTDTAAGFPGRITSVDASILNFGTVDTNGVDFRLSHKITTGFGAWFPSVNATYVHHYTAALVPGGQPQQRLGVLNSDGYAPKWKGVASLFWNREAASAGLSARYTASYQASPPFGTAQMPSNTLYDLQLGYDFGPSNQSPWIRHSKVTLGVINLSNKEPPFLPIFGYDGTQYDLRGRFVYVDLKIKF